MLSPRSFFLGTPPMSERTLWIKPSIKSKFLDQINNIIPKNKLQII